MKELSTLKVKLDEGAIMPRHEYPEDAGYDLFSREEFCLWPGGRHTFDTGVHLDIPDGYYGEITGKSGMSRDDGIGPALNGTIDANFSGSIGVTLFNFGKHDRVFKPGEKIAQIVFHPVETPALIEVVEIEERGRGNNGFGSTGQF